MKTETKLTKGQRIAVYQKVITKEDYEGVATLVKKLFSGDCWHDPNGPTRCTEMWEVRFKNGDKVDRWVCANDLEA